MTYKTCTKCKKPYPATSEFFVAEKQHKDSLSSCCKGCHNQRSCEYYKNNLEKVKQQHRDRYQSDFEYSEKIKQRGRSWEKNNRDKASAKTAKRKALKLNQTPILTESEDKRIKLIYKKSQDLGSDWQVDHIKPLIKGGLHHPDNLQVVTASYNLQKGANEGSSVFLYKDTITPYIENGGEGKKTTITLYVRS